MSWRRDWPFWREKKDRWFTSKPLLPLLLKVQSLIIFPPYGRTRKQSGAVEV